MLRWSSCRDRPFLGEAVDTNEETEKDIVCAAASTKHGAWLSAAVVKFKARK